jgi:hypothetical protein
MTLQKAADNYQWPWHSKTKCPYVRTEQDAVISHNWYISHLLDRVLTLIGKEQSCPYER